MREARANDLFYPDMDQILWCGDGSSDYPAAVEADIVFARENTSLERLCRANNIPHEVFSTFDTITKLTQDWIERHPGTPSKESKEL